MVRSLIARLTLLLLALPVAAQETYVIESAHTIPMYEVRHLGMSLQRGFFTNTVGKVTLDRQAKKGTIDVEIGTGSLASATIKRSEFGMTAGLPNAVGDEVHIVIPVEAVRE